MRCEALLELGHLGQDSKSTLAYFLGIILDNQTHIVVRRAAALALRYLKTAGEDSLNMLVQVMSNHDLDAELRENLAAALGKLGITNEAVLTCLLGFARSKDLPYRVCAASYQSLKTLLNQYSDQPFYL